MYPHRRIYTKKKQNSELLKKIKDNFKMYILTIYVYNILHINQFTSKFIEVSHYIKPSLKL